MMYGTNSSGLIWLHIHWLFWALALFGAVAALLWLNKHANKKDFLMVVWGSILVGVLGGLLTASLAVRDWNAMWEAHHGEERWEELEALFEEQYDEDFDMLDVMQEMMDIDSD